MIVLVNHYGRGIFYWKNTTAGIFVKTRNTYIPGHAPGVADIMGMLVTCLDFFSQS